VLKDARDETLALARISGLPHASQVDELLFAPLDIDCGSIVHGGQLALLFLELATSFAERLPVVLPVLVQPPRPIKLSVETLDRCRRSLTRCSRSIRAR
jgi:hypothetical protein